MNYFGLWGHLWSLSHTLLYFLLIYGSPQKQAVAGFCLWAIVCSCLALYNIGHWLGNFQIVMGLRVHPICEAKVLAAKYHGSQQKTPDFQHQIQGTLLLRVLQEAFTSVPPAPAPRPTGGMRDSPGMLCLQLWVAGRKHWAHLPTPYPEGRHYLHTLDSKQPALWQWETLSLSSPVLGYTKFPAKIAPKESCQNLCSQDLQTHERPRGLRPPPNNETETMPTLTLPSSGDSF